MYIIKLCISKHKHLHVLLPCSKYNYLDENWNKYYVLLLTFNMNAISSELLRGFLRPHQGYKVTPG